MELNIEKNTVTIYSKNYKLDQIAAKLAQLNGSQVYSFFTNRGIFVPRKLNCYAMISILNDKLKLLNSNSLSKDYFTRLQYYKSFSELQLYNLYKEIATFDDFKNYRISLFKLVLYNYVGLNLTDGELQYLINLKKLPMESFEEYFDQVSCACFEQENTFDGQDIDVLKENLEFSAANTEITGLGDKYGIPVPQRLKKTDILEYLYWYLGKQNKLTRDLKQSLDVMTITEISNYIKNENVGISANMTKAELVNYLFFILSQYDIPATTMKRVEILEEYEPLEFKVDLNAVSNFKTDQPKKVIHFKHDSSDDEYYEALSDLYHTTMQQSEIVEEEESVKKLTLEHEAIIPTVQKKMSIADIKARQMGVQSKFQGVEESDDEEFIPALDNDPELDIENSSEEDAILKKAGLDTMDEEIRKAQEEAKIQEAKAKEAEEKARLEAEAKAKNKAQREAEEKRAAEEKAKAEAEKKARDAQILAQAQAYVKQYEARMKKMQEAEAKKQQAQQAAKAITQKKIVKTITKPNGEKVTLEFTPEQFAALKAKKAAELAGQPVDVASIVKAQAAQKAREEALKAKAQSKVVQEQQVTTKPVQPVYEQSTQEFDEEQAQAEMAFESVPTQEENVEYQSIEEQLGDSFSWDMVEEVVSDEDDSFGWTVEEVETVIYVDEDGNEIEGYDESMAGDDVILVEETVESPQQRANTQRYVDDEDDSEFYEPAFNTPAYYEDGANAIRSNLVKSSKNQVKDDKPLSNGIEDERSFLSLNVVVKNANYGDKKLDKMRKKK